MWKRIRQWWQAEGALVTLSGLDDRILADMGLERDGLEDRVLGRSVAGPTECGAGCRLPVQALLN